MLSRQKVLTNYLITTFLFLFLIIYVSNADDLTVTYAYSLYSGGQSVDFSPDGRYIATGDIDGDVGFWEVGEDESIEYVDLGGDVQSVAFRSDSRYLAADGNDGNVIVWLLDVTTRDTVRGTYVHNDASNINSIAYSPGGRYVAVGMDIRWAFLWDLNTDNLWGWGSLEGSEVYDVAFSPDGEYLATGDDTGYLILREVDTWWDDVESTHFNVGGNVQAVAFSPDGKYVAADGFNANTGQTYVNIYNMSDFRLAWQVITDDVYSIAFSPDSQYIAMGDTNATISFYKIGTDVTLVEEINADGTVYDLAWSPDGTLISDGRDVWNVNVRIPSVPIAAATENKIYWADGSDGMIRRSNLDGSEVETVLSNLNGPKHIALDTTNGMIYWSEESVNKILRANLNGSGVEDVLTGLDEPNEIVLDMSNGKIYWLEQGSDKIRRANLNGTAVEDLVNTGLEIDGGIALDITNGKLYWADWHANRILRFNLNGTASEVLLTGPDDPVDIALDVPAGKMYWLEQGADKVRRANLNGTAVEDLVTTGLDRPYEIALDVTQDKMYWTDWSTETIKRANLDGSSVETLLSGLNYPLGIALDLSFSAPSNTLVSLSPSSVDSPDVGEQLTFSINIAEGQRIAGYQAILTYDYTALRFVQGDNGTYLPSGAFFIPPKVDGDTVQLAASSLAGETMGDGTLATITFEVVEVKPSTVTLSDVILTNSQGETTNPLTEDAVITEPPQLPEDVNDDGVVNIVDLTLVASNFGATGTNAADVNGDGVVNIVDLTLVAAAFGNTASAPYAWEHNSEIAPTREQVAQWLQEARQLNLTDPDFQRGIMVLETLLKALTPKETALLPNYPNPFNPETWIPYQLATPADVTVTIYAADGKVIRMLDLGHQPVGIYQNRSNAAYWDGKNAIGEHVASGVYFYTLTAGDFTATRKMLIRK